MKGAMQSKHLLPAALGGKPAFSLPLPFAQPTLEDRKEVLDRIEHSLSTGWLTDGPVVQDLETRAARHFGAQECVAVASCTLGLMLVMQQLDPKGPVVMPSFTFSATAHAAAWNGLDIRFADVDPATWLLDPDRVSGAAGLIVGVHVSGVPCDVARLEELASRTGAQLMFDAAHGAGSLVSTNGAEHPVGAFGAAEVFSLTPTKVLSGAEGGLITTNDSELAHQLRLARNYGNPGSYDTLFPGLNARLSELHAAIALVAFDHLESRVEHRNSVAARYRERLGSIHGVGFQHVPEGSRSSYKDFTITIDGDGFGCSRDTVVAALQAEGVDTRPYYSPPVHRQTAYADLGPFELPVTDRLASQVISLPIWSHLPLGTVDRVCDAVERIHEHGAALERVVPQL
jgi:dTDP-4-amino-4,6-dideoxygalactose transaminase